MNKWHYKSAREHVQKNTQPISKLVVINLFSKQGPLHNHSYENEFKPF